jgi:hypothetical protein
MAASSVLRASSLTAAAGLSANASRVQSGATAGPSAVAALPARGMHSVQRANLRSSSFVSENVGVHFEAVSRGVVARSAASSAVTTCKVC